MRADLALAKAAARRVFLLLPSRMIRRLKVTTVDAPRIRALGLDRGDHPLFDAVYFEVRTRCNGRCAFCAASITAETRDDTTMPAELYRGVIDQLAELGYRGIVNYHINNDPLLFAPLPEFVEYARRKLPGAWILILTNGRALTVKRAEALLTAGINELSINWYDDDLASPLPAAIERIRSEILPRFYRPEQIRGGHGRAPDGEGPIFRFNVFRRRETEVLTTRAGTAPNKHEVSRAPRGFCEFPFRQLNITADGRVSKCCADFYFVETMGNVMKQDVLDIWKDEKFTEVRRALLRGDRSASETCRRCDMYGVFGREGLSLVGKIVYSLTQ